MSKWTKITIGELGTYVNGRGFKPDEWSNKGLPIVRIANLNNLSANFDYFDGELDQGHKIDNGDILVSWSATLDAYIWERGTAALNQHIFKVIPKEEIIAPELLFFVLKEAMHGLSELVHGATMKHVNKPEFEGFEVIIPTDKNDQRRIAASLKAQLNLIEEAGSAALVQIDEVVNLANAIIRQSVEHSGTDSRKLGDVLNEIKKGIGKTWAEYPVLGATRAGLALAKEPVGKSPERYKPLFCGTVFYNPMRIMIGSIAMVDEDDTPGITSPDYVALRGKPGLVDSRWFYYWLRSPYGVSCIASLARGAVRERMLFNRLAEGSIELPPYDVQVRAAKALAELKPMQTAIKKQLNEINLLPGKILAKAFDFN
jgi:type I restriction enzyme S subunit